jgi:hypothetical protein
MSIADKGKALASKGRAAAGGATEAVLDHARANPYAALGAAFAVGYVIGGGLFSPTTRRLLSLGVKLAAIPAVQTTLLGVAEVALDGVLQQGRRMTTAEVPEPVSPVSTPGAPRA